MISIIQTYAKKIQEATDRASGLMLDRIIGYGSYFWGGYVEGSSNIDIAAIVTHESGRDLTQDEIMSFRLNIEPTGIANVPGLSALVIDLFEIEQRRTVTISMHGKILTRGTTLFQNPDTDPLRRLAAASAPSYLVARDTLVAERRRYAAQMLYIACSLFSNHQHLSRQAQLHLHKYVVEESQAAAVFALWAELYAQDVDPSPKELRWNAGRLMTIAAMFDPALEKLVPIARQLPVTRIFNSDTEGFTRADATKACRAAQHICGELGLMVKIPDKASDIHQIRQPIHEF